ncbi:MAG: 4-amino-4-deoxy-L-arabinose transferase [Gammaproteobacteria bacterium]|nr:MAG: 4-amino-4-deoxy-L-arabinose transferase [Gammaproteobacteria bacterium]
MTLLSFMLILTGVLLNAGAQLLLKAGVNKIGIIHLNPAALWHAGTRLAFDWHIVGGIALYVISVVVWLLALSRVPVSVAYPMLSIGYIVNALAAWAWLGEDLSPLRMAGIGVIILGVYMVARS